VNEWKRGADAKPRSVDRPDVADGRCRREQREIGSADDLGLGAAGVVEQNADRGLVLSRCALEGPR
jgi:hypothetical protein